MPAHKPDAPLIGSLQNQLLPDEPWTEAEISKFLDSPSAVAGLVVGRAFGETMPLGFYLARFTADEGDILSIGVMEEARRQGIGRQMLDAVVAKAREAGVRRLHLDVGTDNTAALALYRSFGFGEAGRRPDYYRRNDGRRVDALVLALNLG